MGAVIAVIAVVVVLLVVWGISVQRSLIHLDELSRNAMSQIGVQQESRWDALCALADLTKSYSEHEYETLVGAIAARKLVTASSTAAEAQDQENMISQAMGRFTAVAENYPDLKSNTVYQETMQGVKQYENNVRMSRMVYNDTITKLNRKIRQFPGSMIASTLDFTARDYLEEPQGKTEMPNMGIGGK